MFSGGNKFSKGFIFGCLTFLVLAAFFISFSSAIVLTKAEPVFAQSDYGLSSINSLPKADLIDAINRIIKIILSLLGVIAVILILYGGFVWMTSGGDAKKVAKAKAIISNALIGLIIIFLSYAITSFIIGKLQSATNSGNGGNGGNGGGPGSLPSSIFGIKGIETTYANPGAYHQNVYLCSNIQTRFNHWVSGDSINDADTSGTLKIIKISDNFEVDGSWQILGGTLVFKHPTIFEENTAYQAVFPKSISNVSSPPKFLTACLASGGCIEQGTSFVWNFSTGQESDSVAPYVIFSNPISDKNSTSYPDQNVSKNPIIDVSFSEPVDATTVGSGTPTIPIDNNIRIQKISAKEGSVLQTLDNNNFEVDIKDKGFYLNLSGNNLLDSFSWYRVTLANITDLCNNSLASPYVWEFKTNDQIGNNNDSPCLFNNQCLSNCCYNNICSNSNKCQGGQNGDSCIYHSDCLSGCCSNDKCATFDKCGTDGGNIDDDCVWNTDCSSGCCKSNKCVGANQCSSGGQNGDSCIYHSDCLSGCCSNDKCATFDKCGTDGGNIDDDCVWNTDCSSGCCKSDRCVQSNQCSIVSVVSILSVNPLNGSSNICCNALISVVFNQLMNIGSFKDNIILTQGTDLILGNISSFNQDSNNDQKVDQTVLLFSPKELLKSNSDYQVLVKGGLSGVKSNIGGTMINDYPWSFSTGATICKINKINITVEPPGQVTTSDLFQCAGKNDCSDDQDAATAGNQHRYIAQALDKDNKPLSASYFWVEQQNIGANLLGISSNSISNPLITAINKNGDTILQVQAQSQGVNGKPNAGVERIDVQIFTCENSWPSLTDFPYKDSDTNFSTFYCRDGKTLLTDFDSKVAIPGKGDLIKEFLFKASGEKDAIGIRIMKNSEKLDPLMWYQKYVPNPSNITSITVNGYEAVKSGRTVYVNASNVVDNNVYTNIYLISYNEGASASTINIFNQLVNNWRFNTNVLNLAEKQKLIYDLVRWGDHNEIVSLLESYKSKYGHYPKIESGSYINGVSTSKWPSWQLTLGKELGRALPVDPINQFGDCPGYDPATCWNEQTKKFAGTIPDDVPFNTHVYFYRALNNGNGYDLDEITQYGNDCNTDECSDGGNCYISGSCHPTQALVSCQLGSWQAVWRSSCGNEIADCGEQCDSVQRNYCDIILGDHDWYNEPKFQGCLPPGDPNQCKWNPQQVYTAADCGGWCGDQALNSSEQCDIGSQNGVACNPPYSSNCTYCGPNCTNKIVIGAYCGDDNPDLGFEQCDDGSNNGTACLPPYNQNFPMYCSYCGNDCKVVTLAGGYCRDKQINGPEQCDTDKGDGTSPNNQYLCVSCRWTGGWCGNGIQDYQFGEQCESPGSGTSINNQYGCSICKWTGGWCGNGIQDYQFGEQCDDKENNGKVCTPPYSPTGTSCAYCGFDCKQNIKPGPYCGDGIKNGPEQCDGGECCTSNCQFTSLGAVCQTNKKCDGQGNCLTPTLNSWIQTTYDDFRAGSYDEKIDIETQKGDVILKKGDISATLAEYSDVFTQGDDLRFYDAAQQFEIKYDGKISKITIGYNWIGLIEGLMQPVEIRKDEGGIMGLIPLRSGYFEGHDTPPPVIRGYINPWEFTPLEVKVGEKYWIYIKAAVNSKGKGLEWKRSYGKGGSAYPEGIAYYSDSAQGYVDDRDYYFTIKGTALGYLTGGELTSQVKNTGTDLPIWDNFRGQGALFASNSVVFYTQVSNDGINWDGWQKVTDNNTKINSASKRYIRWKVELSTTDINSSPAVAEVEIKWFNLE